MIIVCVLKKPHFFIIFIANPAWSEIHRKLKSDQQANDWLNLIARVFKMKLRTLTKVKKNMLNSFTKLIYMIDIKNVIFFMFTFCLFLWRTRWITKILTLLIKLCARNFFFLKRIPTACLKNKLNFIWFINFANMINQILHVWKKYFSTI